MPGRQSGGRESIHWDAARTPAATGERAPRRVRRPGGPTVRLPVEHGNGSIGWPLVRAPDALRCTAGQTIDRLTLAMARNPRRRRASSGGFSLPKMYGMDTSSRGSVGLAPPGSDHRNEVGGPLFTAGGRFKHDGKGARAWTGFLRATASCAGNPRVPAAAMVGLGARGRRLSRYLRSRCLRSLRTRRRINGRRTA